MNKLENSKMLIQINNHGAELSRIFSKENNKEYLWNGDSKYWGRYSPVLFPIVGKLNDNETYINGQRCEMGQHGFARDMEFELVSKTDNRVEYSLMYNDETLKKYPFEFKLNIIYTLKDSTVDVTWKVENVDHKEMLFSIGAHPAFNVPFNKEDKLQDYYLTFTCEDKVKEYKLNGPHVDGCEDVDTVEKIDITSETFKNDALIYSGVEEISINSYNSSDKISVSFKNFPFVGIWSPYYNESNTIAPFVCIEPWYGIADRVNGNKKYEEKLGMNTLEIGKTFECTYSISIL